MLRPPVAPKKRTPAVPEQPEIPAAWLEALKNSGTTAAPANAGTVRPGKQFTNVRQAEQVIDSRQQAEANYRAYYDKRVPVKTIDPYMGRDVYSDSVGQMIKFAGDNLIKYPLQSFGRSASLQNANTALNPFSGASTPERLIALGEDAINIASVVPGVRTAVQASDPLKQAGKNYFSGLAASRAARAQARSGWTPSLMQPFEYAPPRLAAARREIGEAGAELSGLQYGSYVKPGGQNNYSRAVTRPEWSVRQPEGVRRFWHTNPQGARLPEKLKSMFEAARMAGRRGTGATQAFSGGPYATDSGSMSMTYFDDLPNTVARNNYPSSVMPESFADQLFPGYGIYDDGFYSAQNLPKGRTYEEVGSEIRQLQLDDFKNQYVGLNARANTIPFSPNSPYYGQDFGKITVKELLDSVDTPEEAMSIIEDSLRPIVFKRDPLSAKNKLSQKLGAREYSLDYDTKEAMLNEEITFRHPIVRGPKGSYTKTAVVDPFSALYLSRNNLRPETMPFSQGYYDKLDNLAAKFKAEKIEETIAGWTRMGRTPDQIALSMDEDYFAYLDKTNPYTYVKTKSQQPKFQMGTTNTGGQNYWDLPITQNADGSIEFVGDLKAIDVTTAGGSKETFENLANEWKDFIYQNYPDLSNNQGVNNLLTALRDLHKSSTKTRGYFQIQNDLTALLNQEVVNTGTAVDSFGDLVPKELFYNHLADRGYGVIPHTGGEIMGGDQHLAMNFLKPELLPSAQYTGPAGNQFDDALARLARARATQMRYVKSNSTGQEFGDFLNKQKLTEAAKQARLAGIQSMLVGSANNTARNR